MLALSSLLEDVFGLDLALPARDQALADVVAALREILVILALASNAVLNVLLLRPYEEVGRIAARWVITFVEHGQALRDGSDPQLIGEPVSSMPAILVADLSVTVRERALPFPAAVVTFHDPVKQTFFEAGLMLPGGQVIWIAACRIVASMEDVFALWI